MNNIQVDEAASATTLSAETIVSPDLFLKRLRRLLVLRYQAAHYLDEEDVRLLDRCVYTTYCDCVELNVGEKARQLLEKARAAQKKSVAR